MNKEYHTVKWHRPGTDPWETRYVIVDNATGEILDDAQGYGYRTVKSAYSVYSYKQKPKKERNAIRVKQKAIKRWCDQNYDLNLELVDDMLFAYKCQQEFTAEDLAQWFEEHDCHNLPFTPEEFLRYG